MHPAPSIIAFTVLSGLGYGLAITLGLNLLNPSTLVTKLAHILSLALISAGLLSSTLHLGNPQRAWRALSQWRSSWLSREGVMALLTFLPLLWLAALSVLFGRYHWLPGLLGVVSSLLTVLCTSMIYASLKSIDAWHTPYTVACFLLFALAGGVCAASLFALLSQAPNATPLSFSAAMLIAGAWAVKWLWRQRLKTGRPTSTPETATQLGHIGRVRLFERPHMTENYLTNEMGFKVARKHADKLFLIALVLGGLLPVVLLVFCASLAASAPLAAKLLGFAAIACLVSGLLVERWLFFAEARHAVMAYYKS